MALFSEIVIKPVAVLTLTIPENDKKCHPPITQNDSAVTSLLFEKKRDISLPDRCRAGRKRYEVETQNATSLKDSASESTVWRGNPIL